MLEIFNFIQLNFTYYLCHQLDLTWTTNSGHFFRPTGSFQVITLFVVRTLTAMTALKIAPCPVERLIYSDKYYDDQYEYRHIIMPKDYAKSIPRNHLMTETEWRNLGIAQSPGWVHYMLHTPGKFL